MVVATALSVPAYAKKVKLTPEERASAIPKLVENRPTALGLDMFWGLGSDTRKPVGPFTFDSEEFSSTSPKMTLTDANGVKWRVKLRNASNNSDKTPAEVVSNKIMWSMNFMANEFYFVKNEPNQQITIPGGVASLQNNVETGEPSRIKRVLTVDTKEPTLFYFDHASFRREYLKNELDAKEDILDKNGNPTVNKAGKKIKVSPTWSFGSQELPFYESNEYALMKILTVMQNDWDTMDKNNEVIYLDAAGGVEAYYMIHDIGRTFGHSEIYPAPGIGTWLNRLEDQVNLKSDLTSWIASDYAQTRFIKGMQDGPRGKQIVFYYQDNPQHDHHIRDELRSVDLDLAYRAAVKMGEWSDSQLKDAFWSGEVTTRSAMEHAIALSQIKSPSVAQKPAVDEAKREADEVERFTKTFENKINELRQTVGLSKLF